MLEKSKAIFGIFSLPPVYNVDKARLKKAYYALSRATHPDVSRNSTARSSFLNSAYATLNDDFLRAKLFSSPSNTLSARFLQHCLALEERIASGEDLRALIDRYIAECMEHYSEPEWLSKWAYYKRLREMMA